MACAPLNIFQTLQRLIPSSNVLLRLLKLYTLDVLTLAVQDFGHKGRMPPHQLAAATGGLSAALVSTLFRAVDPVLPSIPCQELIGPAPDSLHWPSLVLGILCGLLLAQLLDFVVLCRHYVSLALRQRN